MSVIYGQAITLGKSVSGEIAITENGIYDVEDYASANVNVQSAPVLLWTNASPTSNFGQQTINLNGSGYAAYLIESRSRSSNAHMGVSLITVGDFGSTVALETTGHYPTGRVVTSTSANSIVFGQGFLGSQSGDSYGIPTRIWGVKFTL